MSGALHDLNGEVSLNFEFHFFSLSLFIFIGRDQCCNCRTLMRWDDLLTSFSFSTISMQPNSQCSNRNSLFSGVCFELAKSFVQSDYSTGISHSARIFSVLNIFAFSTTIRENIYIFHNVFTCLYCYRVESGERTKIFYERYEASFRGTNIEFWRFSPVSWVEHAMLLARVPAKLSSSRKFILHYNRMLTVESERNDRMLERSTKHL